jgi:catechol 2,3-dioxygenase-like lactoylglutathione lyase family enzyme
MFIGGNVILMVADIDRAVRFYTETVGLALMFRSGAKWAEVQAPGLTIGLHLAPQPDGRSGPETSISIGLEVKEMDPAVKTLTDRGVLFDQISGPPRRLARFRDPDGHQLYLYQMEAPAS